MLSTGMRAPMGLKIYGPDLETIEQSGKAIEQALKDVPSVIPSYSMTGRSEHLIWRLS